MTTETTETAGAALFRIHWDRRVEPYRRVQEGDSHARGRPEWEHLPASQRSQWDQAAADFEAWLRARDGDDEGDGDGHPPGPGEGGGDHPPAPGEGGGDHPPAPD